MLCRSPSCALLPFFGWQGFPTKINYRKKGTRILTSLLEDLVLFVVFCLGGGGGVGWLLIFGRFLSWGELQFTGSADYTSIDM